MTTNRELWTDNGIDPGRRTIRIVGPIDTEMADRVITGLHLMPGDRPIYFLINSEGGDDDNCRAILGAMQVHSAPIHGHVVGIAESAAAWILQLCQWRVMYPHSSLMLHLGDGVKNKHSRYVDKLFIDDVLRRMQEKIPDYLRTKLVANVDTDWNVYPSQCLELGLCDEVLT